MSPLGFQLVMDFELVNCLALQRPQRRSDEETGVCEDAAPTGHGETHARTSTLTPFACDLQSLPVNPARFVLIISIFDLT